MTAHLASPPEPRLLDGGVAGLAQKAYDLADHVWHRALMLLGFHIRRVQHRLWFRGTVGTILVVRLGSIGDVVRSTAVVARLRERYPSAGIDFLTSRAAVPVIRQHPALRTVYVVEDLGTLPAYDWLINLQTADPPESFLASAGLTYREVLAQMSERVIAAWRSGRQLSNGRESVATNFLYCRSEMEELFLTALLPYDAARYPATYIHVDAAASAAAGRKFSLPDAQPLLGVFLGSNSIGCGADEGFRTYSIGYLERVVQQFYGRFAIVVVGQSQVRNAQEREHYADLLRRYPLVVDLVDKTSLDELAAVVGRMAVLVSSDSSPVHIALARGVPVVGLYVLDAAFRMSPKRDQDEFVALNSRPPCFYYTWRWRFFCSTCRDVRSRARYCSEPTLAFGVDRIPVADVERAAAALLSRHGRLHGAPKHD